MAQVFKNNTTGTLAAQLNAGATTCTLNAGHNFTDPGADYYLATLVGVTGTTETSWEIVRVTNVATNTLTITRAQESTADAAWPAGTRIEARATAASTESKANLGTAAYAAAGDFAAAAKGVTNGDSHDHSGGDGAQISYANLSGLPTLGTAAAMTGPSGTIVGTTDSQTLTNKTLTGLRETKTAPTISGGTLTLNCALGNVFAVALNANITTLTFSNIPASGTAYAMTLALTADGTERDVTWGSAVKWQNGDEPTLTSTNGKTDLVVLTTWDGGTTWYAAVAGQNY